MKLLAALLVASVAAMTGAPPAKDDVKTVDPGKADVKVVKITAKKFEFNPSEIHLKKGEPVVLELTSFDRTHGFKIKELDIRVDITTSAVTRVPLTPEKEGTFTFACDVFCGIHHEDMNGTLIIEK